VTSGLIVVTYDEEALMSEDVRTWRIGELAGQAGVTVRTLHHYDRLGLLSPSSRTSGGHRCYTGKDVAQLQRVIALRSCGLSLDEIGTVLSTGTVTDLADLLRDQLDVVDERIRQAVALRVRLLGILDGLDHEAEPSITEILRLIEETNTMNQPLTPQRFEQLKEDRARHAQDMSAEKLTALTEKIRRSWAGLSRDEQIRLVDQRRAMIRAGVES
jgi:MerR family transcriptional regulator, thiopeptide resistance regulator